MTARSEWLIQEASADRAWLRIDQLIGVKG